MNLIGLIAYGGMIGLTGYTVLGLIKPRRRLGWAELLALSGSLGTGITGLLWFWLSLAGVLITVPSLWIWGGLVLGSLGWLWRKNRLIRLERNPIMRQELIWGGILWGWILWQQWQIGSATLSSPLTECDAFAIWVFKAKVLFLAPLSPTPAYFHDLALSYSHLDYPLLIPFLTAGGFTAAGGPTDFTAKALSLVMDSGLVVMLYSGLRWRLATLPATLLTAIFTTLPAWHHYAGCACADVPLALFMTGSAIYTAKWLVEPRREFLICAVLFSSFAAFTKNEGLPWALMDGLIIGLFSLRYRNQRKHTAGIHYFCALAVLLGPWLVWRQFLPHTHEHYEARLLSPHLWEQVTRLGPILTSGLIAFTKPAQWGFLWLLPVAALVLGWRELRRPAWLAMGLLLGLQLTSYVAALIVTPWNLEDLLPITQDRLLLHLIPGMIVLIGWLWTSKDHASALPSPAD